MFWRVAGFTQPSPVETLLDKGTFTLEELLEEDDLIQACVLWICTPCAPNLEGRLCFEPWRV